MSIWLFQVSIVALQIIVTIFSSAPRTTEEHIMEEEETGELKSDQYNLGE
jgi:hypothetical protein